MGQKMKRLTLFLAMLLLIAGCSQTVKIVKVPVPVQPPRAEMPVRPQLMVLSLPDQMPPETKYSELVRMIELDYAKLVEYGKALERLLEAYNKDIDQKYLEGLQSEITIHAE
jgi:hypothetical protein